MQYIHDDHSVTRAITARRQIAIFTDGILQLCDYIIRRGLFLVLSHAIASNAIPASLFDTDGYHPRRYP